MKRLIQIVPALPPKVDGVGDFGLCLARALRSGHGIETTFVCGNPTWEGPRVLEGFPVHAAGPDPAVKFPAILRDHAPAGSAILLNYVGSGYNINSCPLWLCRGLESWRRITPDARLVTMFHEGYSEGPPWTRSFWTNPVQRHICRRLVELSDTVRTNVQIVQRRLENLAPMQRGRIACVPVYSNVGEPAVNQPYAARQPWLAVFGSAGWRQRAYLGQADDLAAACRLLRITKVLDIGAPLDVPVQLPVPLESTGPLPAAQVSELLSQARAGYIAYPSLWMGKSGIFAAYAAHGVVPVSFAGNTDASAEIRAGEHFLTSAMLERDAAGLSAFSEKIFSWYQTHSIVRHAADYVREIAAPELNTTARTAAVPVASHVL